MWWVPGKEGGYLCWFVNHFHFSFVCMQTWLDCGHAKGLAYEYSPHCTLLGWSWIQTMWVTLMSHLLKKKKNYSWPVRRWMQVQGKGKDLDDSPRLISTVNWWDLLLSTTVLFFFYVWSILYLLTYYVFGSLIQSTSVQWLVTLLKHGSNEKLCVCCNFYIVAVGWYLSTGLW